MAYMAYKDRERTQYVGAVCGLCAKEFCKKHGLTVVFTGGKTQLLCTLLEQTCAEAHVNGTCNHDHKPKEAKPTGAKLRDNLPRGVARKIYDHFGTEPFMTRDATRHFNRYAGHVMKELRAEGLVKYQLCGEREYIHRFV